MRHIKAKVGPKKVESVESEGDTLPKSLHVFHGDNCLDFEVQAAWSVDGADT